MAFITAFFRAAKVPAIGLSPAIDAFRVSDQVQVLTAQAMTEIGLGWYFFDFTAFVPGTAYVFRMDGGASQADGERYVTAANEVPTNLAGTRVITGEPDGPRLDITYDPATNVVRATAWLVRNGQTVTTGLVTATLTMVDPAGATVVVLGPVTSFTAAGKAAFSGSVTLANNVAYITEASIEDAVGAETEDFETPTIRSN